MTKEDDPGRAAERLATMNKNDLETLAVVHEAIVALENGRPNEVRRILQELASDLTSPKNGMSFLSAWDTLPDAHRAMALSSTLVAQWLKKDVRQANIIMKLLGWKEISLNGKTFWFEPRAFERFLKEIDRYLWSSEDAAGGAGALA